MSGSVDMAHGVCVDDQGRLDQNVSCAWCDYNLRTLSVEWNCPECGRPVIDSLWTQRLCFADRRWVKKLIRGLTLVLLCPVIYMVAGFSLTLIDNNRVVSAVLYVTLCLLFGLHFIGHWFFTSRPRPWFKGSVSDTRRRIARAVLIATTVTMLVYITWGQFGHLNGIYALPMMGVTGMVFVFVMLTYARKLALCIPDRGLAKLVLRMMWIWEVSIVVVIPLIYFNSFLVFQLSSPWGVIIGGVVKVTVICFYMVILAGLVVMIVYRRRLVKVYKGME